MRLAGIRNRIPIKISSDVIFLKDLAETDKNSTFTSAAIRAECGVSLVHTSNIQLIISGTNVAYRIIRGQILNMECYLCLHLSRQEAESGDIGMLQTGQR